MANEEALSQEQINSLLAGMGGDAPEAGPTGSLTGSDLREPLGELVAIAMAAASSSLSAGIDKAVESTPPTITEYGFLAEWEDPFPDENKLLVIVPYAKGQSRPSLYIVKATHAKGIADMIFGEDEAGIDAPLNDMQLAAFAEAMNQMMTAAASSLSTVISETIEPQPAEVKPFELEAMLDSLPQLAEEAFLGIRLQLNITDAFAMDIVELRAQGDARQMVEKVMSLQPNSPPPAMSPPPPREEAAPPAPPPATPQPQPTGGFVGVAPPPQPQHHGPPVTVQPVQFAAFDNQSALYGEANKNLELVMDVTLNLTVELGKTEISIKEVLELTRGSVIELDRIAGEPVDLLANGKLIAKGEVVVIEDNFGLRITSIVSPAERLRGV